VEKEEKRKRRKFTQQYKAETVRLIQRSALSATLALKAGSCLRRLADISSAFSPASLRAF